MGLSEVISRKKKLNQFLSSILFRYSCDPFVGQNLNIGRLEHGEHHIHRVTRTEFSEIFVRHHNKFYFIIKDSNLISNFLIHINFQIISNTIKIDSTI